MVETFSIFDFLNVTEEIEEVETELGQDEAPAKSAMALENEALLKALNATGTAEEEFNKFRLRILGYPDAVLDILSQIDLSNMTERLRGDYWQRSFRTDLLSAEISRAISEKLYPEWKKYPKFWNVDQKFRNRFPMILKPGNFEIVAMLFNGERDFDNVRDRMFCLFAKDKEELEALECVDQNLVWTQGIPHYFFGEQYMGIIHVFRKCDGNAEKAVKALQTLHDWHRYDFSRGCFSASADQAIKGGEKTVVLCSRNTPDSLYQMVYEISFPEYNWDETEKESKFVQKFFEEGRK